MTLILFRCVGADEAMMVDTISVVVSLLLHTCGSRALQPLHAAARFQTAVANVAGPEQVHRGLKISFFFLNLKLEHFLPYVFKTGWKARMTEVIYMKVIFGYRNEGRGERTNLE